MRQFLTFVRKEFYHIFRDRRTMMILLAMPIIMIILFGFAITTEVNNARIAVYAPSNDELSRTITERFNANGYFRIVEIITDHRQIDQLFKDNKVDVVLVFEGNFQNNLMHTGTAAVQLIVDGSEPNSASIMSSYASSVLSCVQSELLSTPAAGSPGVVIVPTIKLLYNPQMKSSYNFVPGVMGLILMLICAMMTSISIVREKERGTMEILLVSPMRPFGIILAKVVPYFCISIFNVVTVLVLATFVLGVPVAGSLFWILVLCLVYIFGALALGITISSVVGTQVAAMLVSGMGLMMPVMMLSGMIFPIENMPAVLRWISNIIPARWFIEALKKLMIQGLPVRYITKELLILSGMGVALIAVSLRLFKNRLE